MVDEAKAREALAHVQKAALELIAAARAALDVAEEVVRDPGEVGEVLTAVSALLSGRPAPERPWEQPSGGREQSDDAAASAEPPASDAGAPPRKAAPTTSKGPRVKRVRVE